jgi:hypothetical protein
MFGFVLYPELLFISFALMQRNEPKKKSRKKDIHHILSFALIELLWYCEFGC